MEDHLKPMFASQSVTHTPARKERRALSWQNRFRRWFFEGMRSNYKKTPSHQDAWWKVMCLTGTDYFSSVGYAPGIAYLAAGLLSPIATLIVVIVTLFGLVPLYSRVARESPHGQGSVAMLENLLPGWRGKTIVLLLLGFAATDFVITITLSAADATAHIVENPLVRTWLSDRIAVTLVLLAVLGGVFLKGFREAIGVSFACVSLYLFCNVVVGVVSLYQVFTHLEVLSNWQNLIYTSHHGSTWAVIGISLLLFPKLALGMSGFETGVAVMPLVKGDPHDDPESPQGRIKNTRKLLLTAAVIMSFLLLTSSLTTTTLIPPEAFREGGAANGRALAYLAHLYLGHEFGTIYDVSTILILWFAGASAMAGLLSLVPRYLPRYGMAPEWARAQRPLVVFFTFITFVVTVIFRANVDAQAGAYATGVLVLITSAALAVSIVTWKEGALKRYAFLAILLAFIYTSITNMIERPEGLHIASFFITTIMFTSIISRVIRSFEIRISDVALDAEAERLIDDAIKDRGQICLLAHRPGGSDYANKEFETRTVHKLTLDEATFIFLEVSLSDPSEFIDDCLHVTGYEIDGVRILRCQSPAIPNAIAAILLYLRDKTNTLPHAYFGWTEGHPLAYVFRYIFLGEGETAPVTREILREAEKDANRRPKILVG